MKITAHFLAQATPKCLIWTYLHNFSSPQPFLFELNCGSSVPLDFKSWYFHSSKPLRSSWCCFRIASHCHQHQCHLPLLILSVLSCLPPVPHRHPYLLMCLRPLRPCRLRTWWPKIKITAHSQLWDSSTGWPLTVVSTLTLLICQGDLSGKHHARMDGSVEPFQSWNKAALISMKAWLATKPGHLQAESERVNL